MAATIRAATLVDLDRVVAIERSAFGATAWPFEIFRQHLDLSGELFAVAVDEPGVAGYALASRSASPEVAWILSGAVDPPCRGRGLGRALLAHVIARGRSLGVSCVRLTVRPGNEPMEHVVRALGFTEIAYDPAYFGPGHPRRILELR